MTPTVTVTNLPFFQTSNLSVTNLTVTPFLRGEREPRDREVGYEAERRGTEEGSALVRRARAPVEPNPIRAVQIARYLAAGASALYAD